jgi:hypothetical protein
MGQLLMAESGNAESYVLGRGFRFLIRSLARFLCFAERTHHRTLELVTDHVRRA